MNHTQLSATIVLTLLMATPSHAADPTPAAKTWTANPAVVAAVSKDKKFNYDEAKVGAYKLPDPLVDGDGAPVTRDNWPARRHEILEQFRTHVYGRPVTDKPKNLSFRTIENDPSDLDGRATRKLIEISFDTPHAGRRSFRIQLYIPNAAPKPVPAVVLLQFQGLVDDATPLVIDRGYALAILDRTGAAADDKEAYRDAMINAFQGEGPLPPDAGRAIAAWAWAASRVLDYLETDPSIDVRRVAVAGHSRMGKTALWAAASDPRFAMAYSNNSGCGGAALARRNFGETVGRINTVFPHWFCENHHGYNDRVADLPVDQHMLIALIAPRLVYVTSADEDLWADPRGEFLSCVHAGPVYKLHGVDGLESDVMPPLDQPLHAGRIGYHIRTGRHDLTEYDWRQFLDFADRHAPTPSN
jgi:hypothetical protein